MANQKIGRYEVKEELGRGGMATVYRAYDPSFEREVAIKLLPREFLHDPQFRDRFKREIKTIAALEHPAIVPVYDVGEEDGVPYFVMRYMTGGSLAQQINKGIFSLQDAARIIERLASALSYAHTKGVVHRDLKPDNILFDGNGEPFISDFGVAKFSGSSGDLTGSGIIGTPAYMSPEQAQGEKIDNRSDIYGLGVIIFQMLSGQQPYKADTPMGVVVKHITDPIPEIHKITPNLPEEADTIIKTALAKDREQRYQTALELSTAMNSAAFGTSPGGKGAAPRRAKTGATPAAGGRRGLIFGGVAIVVIALLGGFIFRNQIMAAIAPPPPTSTATLAPAATSTALQTEAPSLPTATVVVFAPFCQPDTQQVNAPVVTEKSRNCEKKHPYTTVSIPAGATFQSMDPEMTCETSGSVSVVACGGNDLIAYPLQVCSPIPTLEPSGTGQCPEGAAYDSSNQCCLKPAAEDTGCVIFQVGMKDCSQSQ